MNQTFDLRRFNLVLRLHFSEHLRTYLMGIGILFGIWIIMLIPNIIHVTHFSESLYRSHGTLFGFIFCGAGAWFASESFRVVGTPMRGIPFLTLPASQFEKYLVACLMLILFVLVFLGVFYTVEGAAFSLVNARLPQDEPRYHLLDLSGTAVPIELQYVFIAGIPFFFLGSIYFSKVPFVKTGVIAFALLFGIIFLNEFIIKQLFPSWESYGAKPFRSVTFLQHRIWYDVALSGTPKMIVDAFLILTVAGLWVATYIRFKEKEV
ncbi:hypothetical protein M0L20_04710 [Spirosoma sp. RP8]|uniref:ABC transporter permease n=1 Tax=Spirosoma liriopis TaxID=2937440 RepID=A0ABT0HG54_9BACT|nr:hypothetical protein [Spirosoma liriopis]MCK8491141.1 hypothetical protein [Spirosoma liriopis]